MDQAQRERIEESIARAAQDPHNGVTEPFREGGGFARHNGIKVTCMTDCYASAEVKITEEHYNLIDIPHGGIYFALADTTFGAFSNYYANKVVTLTATIDYIASAKLGDTLIAHAFDTGSTTTIIRSDIVIVDQNGKHLSTLHCTGYRRRERS